MINRDGTKKILKIIIITCIVCIVIGYTVFASHNLISGPKIIISEPINGMTTSTGSITIKGLAYHIQDITLNGRPVTLDTQGNINETILLTEGYNSNLFSAKDKFNRTTEYKLELVYRK